MPITVDEFKKGVQPNKRNVQGRILAVLSENQQLAFSSKELEEITGARRESINQALRALEDKDLINRGLMIENKRLVMYASIKREEDDTLLDKS